MLTVAIGLFLVIEIYYLFTTLVDLAPLNNVASATRRERVTEVAVNAPIMAVPLVLVVLAGVWNHPALAYAGGGIQLAIVLNGLALWWLPYLADVTVPWATAGTGGTWSQLHARTYAKTIIVLPAIGDRPRPNLEHMILHALMLAAAIFALGYAGTA